MLEHFYSRFHPIVCLMFLLAFVSLYIFPLLGPWGPTWIMGVAGLVVADFVISQILQRRAKPRNTQPMQRGFDVIPTASLHTDEPSSSPPAGDR